jgi:Domain of unknown function (DUF1707)
MADSEPGRGVERSELRAFHEDRDRVFELLRVSAGDGRLTAEELDERLEGAADRGERQGRQRALHRPPAAPDVLAVAEPEAPFVPGSVT